MASLTQPHREWDGLYVEPFDFLEPPFPNTPGRRFECGTRSRARALEGVINAVKRRERLTVVTGGEGTGKTTLCVALPEHFGARTLTSTIFKPPPTSDELLRHLMVEFSLVDPQTERDISNRDDQYAALQGFLFSLSPLQGQAVVVIDEAHDLSHGVLEEILRLTKFEGNHPGLLQIVLVGRPTLLDVLQQPGVDGLRRRVVGRHTLPPFGDAEVGQYIERQIWSARGGVAALPVVNASDRVPPGARTRLGPRFTPSAVGFIARTSSGNPRAINAICERALAIARDSGTDRITGRLARSAATDLGLSQEARRLWPRPSKAASVMVAMLAASALVFASWDRWPSLAETAAEVPTLSPDQPFEELRRGALRLGASLSVEPNVKQLLKLRDDVHLWDTKTKYASHGAVEDLLVELEGLTDEARQRQLEKDRALILDDATKRVP